MSKLANILRSLLIGLRHRRQPSPAGPFDGLISPERDRRRNADSTPPADEHIDRPCIWGVEFFTPAYIDSLEEGLQRLGWERGDPSTTSPDPIAWLRDLGRHRHSGGSLPLGPLITDESPDFLFAHRVPELPQSAELAFAHISSITPSLFSVTVCFVIRESVVATLNRILHEQKTSYLTSQDGRNSLHDPYSQKSKELEQARKALRGEIADWFARFLPGVFSSEERRDIPTWEFVTTETAHPALPEAGERPSHWSYLTLIGFRLGSGSWTHTGVPSLHLNADGSRNHPLLVANRSSLRSMVQGADEFNRNTLVHAVYYEALLDILPAWAMVPLVDLYTRHLLNDVVRGDGSVERALDRLQEGGLRRIDRSTVASELRDISEGEHWFWDDSHGLARTWRVASVGDTRLSDHLRFVVGNQASWLHEADRSSRDNTLHYGTLLAAAESIRLQRTTKRLTYAVMLLAIVAAMMPFIAARCL